MTIAETIDRLIGLMSEIAILIFDNQIFVKNHDRSINQPIECSLSTTISNSS